MSGFFKKLFFKEERSLIKLIVFDFDGTIADTRDLIVRIISSHLGKFNISLTKNLLLSLGDTPLESFVSIAGLKKDFVKSVSRAIIEDFISEYRKIKPCKNLDYIKSVSVRKIIVSNNSTEFIKKSLNLLNANFFDSVYGADHFTDKVHAIAKLLQKYHLDPEEIIYVGDKNIDVGIARAVGCYSVIVSNKSSWSSRAAVAAEKPDYLIRDLGKINDVLDSINMSQFSPV